jgi:alkylation response protein AidB-like acyl-CoA dehydrogenase
MVSETKKFVTESCQKVANNSMQVMGGIGYTNVYPIERICRDLRLASIWTGTNEVMAAIVANEWYKEYAGTKQARLARDHESDSLAFDAIDEKIYE